MNGIEWACSEQQMVYSQCLYTNKVYYCRLHSCLHKWTIIDVPNKVSIEWVVAKRRVLKLDIKAREISLSVLPPAVTVSFEDHGKGISLPHNFKMIQHTFYTF